MKYQQYVKLEEHELSKGRRELGAAYVFIIISAAMFIVFFWSVQELLIIGCAFLCDAAATVYLLRSLGHFRPFRQASLARKCAEKPSDEAVYKFCAALETARTGKYGSGSAEAFGDALAACEKKEELVSEEAMALLKRTLEKCAGMEMKKDV